jgi:hypothetical protein
MAQRYFLFYLEWAVEAGWSPTGASRLDRDRAGAGAGWATLVLFAASWRRRAAGDDAG